MRPSTRYWLRAILAAAFILRLAALPFDQEAHDDTFTMECATAPTRADTLRISVQDTHIPLYYFIIRALFIVMPDQLPVARVFSILMSVAAIYVTFLIARRFFEERVALLSAALYTFTPFNIFWAHMARNHQLLTLIGALATLYLFRYLKHRRRSDLIGYGATLVLTIQTNYMGLMILGTHTAILAVHEWRRTGRPVDKVRRAMRPLSLQLLAALTLLPWIWVIRYHLTEGPAKRDYFESPMSFMTPVFHAFFGHMSFQPGLISLYVLLPALAISGLIIYINVKRLRQPEIWLYTFLQPALPFAIASQAGLSLAIRHFAYIVPAVMIFAAFGLIEVWKLFGERLTMNRHKTQAAPPENETRQNENE